MRRILVFLLLITGLLTIIAGIAEGLTHQNRPYVLHIVVASIFIITCIIHIVINRKAVLKYIRGGK
jgi:uncharacterized membrane protein HdeD (DUF308 family)